MKKDVIEVLKKWDFTFFLTVICIFTVGALNLYSAVHSNPNKHMAGLYLTQILYFCVALVIGIVASFINTKTIYRYTYFLYGSNVFLLILVLFIGDLRMGGRRWLVLGPLRFQPSEIMKITLVLTLSRWFAKVAPDKELGFGDLLVPSALTLFPAILIMLEPDLGTGLLLILIFFFMALYRKLKLKTLAILGVIAVITGLGMYNFALKPYQRQRIVTFLNPRADAKGSGYNAIQSEIAIGSGQLLGKGFKKSSQASLNYLPENHTDFVFSIFNEEHGLLGSLFLISLYIILLLRFIWLSQSVLKFYDSLVSIGLMSIFFWHTFINMSMVMGLMPIVGLPLPLMSYGGSSLVLFVLCAGVATSISNSRTIF